MLQYFVGFMALGAALVHNHYNALIVRLGDDLSVAQTIDGLKVDGKPEPQLDGNSFGPRDVDVEAWSDLDTGVGTPGIRNSICRLSSNVVIVAVAIR